MVFYISLYVFYISLKIIKHLRMHFDVEWVHQFYIRIYA
jgi:hypothetical protein